MDNKFLVEFTNVHPKFPNHAALLANAREKFGDIKTFFGGNINPVGIEVEVEAFGGKHSDFIYWRQHQDGSLRNGGIELISPALSGHNIDYALAELKDHLTRFNPSWSIRTSIHVHVNVTHLKVKNFIALIALYAFFEEVLWTFVDPKRRGNPYCYPITTLTPDEVTLNAEIKYCAFNPAPAATYGTVEFRHLEGTSDSVKLRRWVQICSKLVQYAANNPGEKLIREIKMNQNPKELFKRIFGITATLFDRADFNTCEANRNWAVTFIGDNACAVSGE